MQLSSDILSFLAEPVTIILGTRGDGFTPDVGRGVGLCAAPGRESVDVMISRGQWPATVANLRANGALAMTVSAPQTYRTYQFKGQAQVRPASDADRDLAADYARRMIHLFEAAAMPEAFAGKWLSLRDVVVARLAVEETFIQTPGAQAGQPAGDKG